MKAEELNRMLDNGLPQLHDKYAAEIQWQRSEGTGSHVIYGNLLMPYLTQIIVNDDKENIEMVFGFLENVLKMDDAYSEEVIAFSVIEGVVHLLKEKDEILSMMGENTRKIYDEIVEYDRCVLEKMNGK